MSGTYLLLDAVTLLPTLLFSFHRRIAFYRHAGTYLPALAMTAAVFLAWDAYFTRLGVWGFNPRYLTGGYIGNLPVEEWLFFLCIPYACVFTVYCRRLGLAGSQGNRAERIVTPALIGVLLIAAFTNLRRRYTAVTFLSLSLMLGYCSYILRARWLGRFYVGWLLLLLPLLLVDGVLTGTGMREPIVWYDPRDILGMRILTIPVEDFFYGMELVLLNLLFYDLVLWIGRDRENRPRLHEIV